MASSESFLQFILSQLDGLEGISSRKMMGEYLLYVYGKGIGGIYDDRFLIKRTVPGEALLPPGREALPYPGAKPMLLVEEVDDREFLQRLVLCTYEALPEAKKRP